MPRPPTIKQITSELATLSAEEKQAVRDYERQMKLIAERRKVLLERLAALGEGKSL